MKYKCIKCGSKFVYAEKYLHNDFIGPCCSSCGSRIVAKDSDSIKEHYTEQGIDTFKRCKANLSKEEQKAICKFNIDKYLWREKEQNLSDIKKIRDYLNWLEELENDI